MNKYKTCVHTRHPHACIYIIYFMYVAFILKHIRAYIHGFLYICVNMRTSNICSCKLYMFNLYEYMPLKHQIVSIRQWNAMELYKQRIHHDPPNSSAFPSSSAQVAVVDNWAPQPRTPFGRLGTLHEAVVGSATRVTYGYLCSLKLAMYGFNITYTTDTSGCETVAFLGCLTSPKSCLPPGVCFHGCQDLLVDLLTLHYIPWNTYHITCAYIMFSSVCAFRLEKAIYVNV